MSRAYPAVQLRPCSTDPRRSQFGCEGDLPARAGSDSRRRARPRSVSARDPPSPACGATGGPRTSPGRTRRPSRRPRPGAGAGRADMTWPAWRTRAASSLNSMGVRATSFAADLTSAGRSRRRGRRPRTRPRWARVAMTPPEQGLDPGRELVDSERFGEVVVGTSPQAPNFVGFVGVAGQHQDRNGRDSPGCAAAPASRPGRAGRHRARPPGRCCSSR